MIPPLRLDREGSPLQILWEDGERIFCRTWRDGADGHLLGAIAVVPAEEHPTPRSIDRLRHEYELKDHLDSAWAARPLDLVRDAGRTMLVLQDSGGEPLERLLNAWVTLCAFGTGGVAGRATEERLRLSPGCLRAKA